MGLKDLLFKSPEETAAGKAANGGTVPVPGAFPTPVTSFNPSFSPGTVPTSAPATVDPEIKAKLDGIALGAPNRRSYDEFAKQLQALGAIISIEDQKYKAALVSSGTGGHTKAQVLVALGAILDALDTHAREFRASAPKKIEEIVGVKQAELKQVEDSLAGKLAEVQRLQQEIQQLQGVRGTAAAAIDSERKRVEARVAHFEGSFRVVRSVYEAEQAKINRYGEGVN